MKAMGRVALRTGVGLGALSLLSGLLESIGVNLGVNLVNGLLMGFLGVPGFGLLLMLNWLVR